MSQGLDYAVAVNSVTCKFFMGFALLAFAASTAAADSPRSSKVLIEQIEYSLDDANELRNVQGWIASRLWDVPADDGVVWIRGSVTLPPNAFDATRPTALLVSALASCEIFWDGALHGTKGQPGLDKASELPGQLEARLFMPAELLTPGDHQVALRCSTHHRGHNFFVGFYGLFLGDLETMASAGPKAAATVLVSFGAMVLASLLFFLVYVIADRHPAHLVLSLLGLLAAAILVAEASRTLYGYPYDWHVVRLIAITALAYAINLALVLFFLIRFELPWARRWLVATGLALGVPIVWLPSFDGKALFMFVVGLTVAIGLGGWASWRRQPSALLASAGVMIAWGSLVLDPFNFLDRGLYWSLDALWLCLLVAHARETLRERQRRQAAEVRSVRLENELLKKHLHPHFLLNSLTAMAEWFDRDPSQGSAMVEALASELALLAEISDRPLISLADELELCRFHLAVMSLRQDCRFRLEAQLDSYASLNAETRQVPPAIFHTLLENAHSHQRYSRDEVVFMLREDVDAERVLYTFDAPLGRRRKAKSSSGGTGLGYVRARLEESFGNRWRLEHGATATTWQTRLSLPRDLVLAQELPS